MNGNSNYFTIFDEQTGGEMQVWFKFDVVSLKTPEVATAELSRINKEEVGFSRAKYNFFSNNIVFTSNLKYPR